MRTCMSIADICRRTGYQPYDNKYCLDGTEIIPWYTNANRVLASEEYYKYVPISKFRIVGCNFGENICFLCLL